MSNHAPVCNGCDYKYNPGLTTDWNANWIINQDTYHNSCWWTWTRGKISHFRKQYETNDILASLIPPVRWTAVHDGYKNTSNNTRNIIKHDSTMISKSTKLSHSITVIKWMWYFFGFFALCTRVGNATGKAYPAKGNKPLLC